MPTTCKPYRPYFVCKSLRCGMAIRQGAQPVYQKSIRVRLLLWSRNSHGLPCASDTAKLSTWSPFLVHDGIAATGPLPPDGGAADGGAAEGADEGGSGVVVPLAEPPVSGGGG